MPDAFRTKGYSIRGSLCVLPAAGMMLACCSESAGQLVQWAQRAFPAARDSHAMAYDSARGVTIMFGGAGASPTNFGDTWAWNGGAWSPSSTGGPSARWSHAACYDSGRGVIVLFGGTTWAGGANGETWEWNGSAWAQRSASGPSARYAHAMAYDSVRGVTVLFGGTTNGFGGLGDTWEWNGTAWTQRATTGPSARYGHGMAFDAARNATVLFGGFSAGSATWEWNGTAWTQRATSGPSQRFYCAMAYDAARGQTVMFGGTPSGLTFLSDTWEWNGTAWTQRASAGPFSRAAHAMAYDSGRGVMTLFGGFSNGEDGDTWEWNGTAWSERSSGVPSARYEHALSYDAARQRVVMFGGETAGQTANRETWEWRGGSWVLRATNGPAARTRHRMVFDVVRNATLLFGGGSPNGSTLYGDTWEWNGSAWTQRASTGPAPRFMHSMAFDAGRGVTVLWGGNTASGVNGETWEWNGNAWALRSSSGPAARYGQQMAYDAARGETLLFGGWINSSQGIASGETWAWNGTIWALRSSAGPAARAHHAMAFDSNRGTAILFGGGAQGVLFSDTWEWNGSAWRQQVLSGPAARSGHGMAFDAGTRRALLFGGTDALYPNYSYLNDTWEYSGEDDCNTNGVPDDIDTLDGFSADCNTNAAPDECELIDCNTNGTIDLCDIAGGAGDCNTNQMPDACELAGHDCNTNFVPDVCELPGRDCNSNGTLDACELAGRDCNTNATPDACELSASTDANGNGTLDACEVGPDLVVTSITVPGAGLAGQSFDLRFRITNVGNATATGPWLDQVYVSADAQIGGDTAVNAFAFSGTLLPGQSYDQVVPVMLPGNPGAYYYVIVTDSGNAVHELFETNNAAISANAVSVQPLPMPDLVVTQVNAPTGNVLSGSMTAVSWIVQNTGAAATSAPQWFDEVFISADPNVDFGGPGGDQQLCNEPLAKVHVANPSYLAPGGSYLQQTLLQIPHNLEGPYYVYVVTDRPGCRNVPGHVAEVSDTNNLRRGGPFMIDLEAQPDLIATAVNFPIGASSGTSFTVQWTEHNVGMAATLVGTWTDAVYLSTNSNPTVAGDILFGQRTRSGTLLAPGASEPASVTQLLPASLNGPYYVKVVVNANGAVPEINGPNNNVTVSAGQVTVTRSPSPDLLPMTVTVATNGIPAHPIQVAYTVHNEGANPLTGMTWVDKVYLSADAVLDPNVDLLLATAPHSTIYTGGQFVIPDYDSVISAVLRNDLASGSYYVLVAVDANDQVYEENGEGNNVKASMALQVQLVPTDLQITAGTPGNPVPQAAPAGQSVPVQWQVVNAGQAVTPVAAWNDAVFLSTDATLSAGDVLLASVSHSGALAPTATYTGQATLSIPAGTTPGAYYLLFVTDQHNQVYEQAPGESNNVVSSAFTVFPPTITYLADLAPIDLAAPSMLPPGQPFTAQFTVSNLGNASTVETAWIDRLYLSTDTQVGPEDIVLGSVAHNGALGANQSYSASQTFTTPASAAGGMYYLILRTDAGGQVFEANESNNTRALAITIPGQPPLTANLTVPHVSAPAMASAGQTIEVEWTVANTGEAPTNSAAWRDSIFLSSDAILNSGDVLIGTYEHNSALTNGAERTITQSFAVPSYLSGARYVIVLTDSQNAVQENNRENDNVGVASAATQIQGIAQPNLQVQNVVAPNSATSGQTIAVSWTTLNASGAGPTPSGTWTDAVFLSRDLIPNAAVDVYLGGYTHSAPLGGGEQRSINQVFSVPAGLSGPYAVIVVADYHGQIAESLEQDNYNYAPNLTDVILPDPGNLVVTSVSASGSYTLGQSIGFAWQIQNQGSNTVSGSWSDSIFLSPAPTWNVDTAVFVGRYPHPPVTLNPGQSTPGSATFAIPPVDPGAYYVIVKADVFNQIPETSEADNTGSSTGTLSAAAQPLQLGVPFSGPLAAGDSRYFAVTVPAGQTIRIALTHQSATAWTEVYVREGHTPTLAYFDVASQSPDHANQTVTVPTSHAATYYILTRATFGTSPGATDMTILAEAIPFGISGVLPGRAGNGDRVTLRISGARFDSSVSVALHGPGGITLNPAALKVVNGEQLRARFNFSTAPFGLYDVVVTDGTGQARMLSQALTVEPAQPMSVMLNGFGDLGPRTRGAFVANGAVLNTSNVDSPYVSVFATLDGVAQIGWSRPASALPGTADFPEAEYHWSTQSATSFVIDGTTSDGFYLRDVSPGEQISFSAVLSAFPAGAFNFGLAARAESPGDFSDRLLETAEECRQVLVNGHLAELPAEVQAIAIDPAAWRTRFVSVLAQVGIVEPGLRSRGGPPYGQDIHCDVPARNACLGGVLTALAGRELQIAGQCVLAGPGALDCFLFRSILPLIKANFGAAYCLYKNCDLICPMCANGERLWGRCSFSQFFFSDATQGCGQARDPVDPNEKVGPPGVGAQNIVARVPLLYRVYFENLSAATATAATVTVTDDLDPAVQAGSLRLSRMHVGDVDIVVPPNRIAFQNTLDLTASKGIRLNVSAGVDAATRRAFWNFESVDPVTGQRPDDPDKGILPAEDGSGRGRGYIEYTVTPSVAAATGSIVRNGAKIRFDNNPPIITNVVQNVLDVDPPASMMLPLPAVSAGPTIPLAWTGADAPGGSGLSGFTIYVSRDGGPAMPILTNVPEQTGSYTGEPGRQYSFYSTAIDAAGNVEPAHAMPDATTLVPLNVPVAPLVTLRTAVTIRLSPGGDPGTTPNPIDTEYAMVETGSGQFLGSNGRLGPTPVWRTAAAWALNGTVRALQPSTAYAFAVKARNSHGETPPGPAAMVATQIQGDVNGDGRVSAADVTIVQATRGIGYGSPGFNPAADLNGDDQITQADVTIVQNALPCPGAGTGDFNGDGFPSAADVPAFVAALLNPTPALVCVGDVNDDGALDGQDVQAFVNMVH